MKDRINCLLNPICACAPRGDNPEVILCGVLPDKLPLQKLLYLVANPGTVFFPEEIL